MFVRLSDNFVIFSNNKRDVLFVNRKVNTVFEKVKQFYFKNVITSA